MSAVTGGCQCRAITYRLAPKRHQVYACHCLECQHQSASAFALSMPVKRVDLTVDGKPAVYVRPTDSGTRTLCHFCPACGSRLYHQSERSPDLATLKAGSLDDTSALVPVAHFWVKRKQPWILLPSDVPQFETQPEDLKAWRDRLVP